MTVKEKQKAISHYCYGRECPGCLLESTHDVEMCYSNLDYVEEHFNRLVEHGELPAEVPDETSSNVDHPSHYNQGGIECIDAMVAAFGKVAVENFCLLNAFKYVWRNRDKNGFEDIDKAIWYLKKFEELVGSD